MPNVKGAKRKLAPRYRRPAAIQSAVLPQHARMWLRPPPSRIHNGDTVAAVDLSGVTWFGVAMGEVELDRPWPAVRVMVGQRIMIFPARDVSLWPAPENLMAQRVNRRARHAGEN